MFHSLIRFLASQILKSISFGNLWDQYLVVFKLSSFVKEEEGGLSRLSRHPKLFFAFSN
jgi:hypothetical protein